MTREQTDPAAAAVWERVYTVNDYYDGPRRGIADFCGKPHIYESEFSDIEDEYTNSFVLVQIESELLDLVLEDWAIWLRWQAAYQHREVSLDTHPALPHERQRHEELKQRIGGRLRVEPSEAVARATAEFRNLTQESGRLEVRWHEIALHEVT
jgi:hypothetical protein